jgi:hypothetical protein
MPTLPTATKLLPFRQINEQDKLNLFSLNSTGELGAFVSIVTGTANMDDMHGYSTTTPGASFNHAYSYRYKNNMQVRPSQSGDKRDLVVGITLNHTLEEDENGQKYLYYKQKGLENQVVVSGQAVPILTKGVVTLKTEAFVTGTCGVNRPKPGQVFAPASTEPGKVFAFGRQEIVSGFLYSESQILGKVLATGSKFGGYALVQFDCSAE